MLEKLQNEGYDTTVYTFGPGTVFGNHSHSVSKKDAILEGRFLFRMDGEEVWHQLFTRSSSRCVSKRMESLVLARQHFSISCSQTRPVQVILEKGDQLEVPAGATHYVACVGSEPVTFVDASKY